MGKEINAFVKEFSVKGILLGALLLPQLVMGQVLPGAADIDRVPQVQVPAVPRIVDRTEVAAPDEMIPIIAPEGSDEMFLTLQQVSIEGATVYSESDFLPLYEAQVGQRVSLADVWKIAAAITKKYRDEGYFLTRAYVPAQEVADGRVTIHVVEGYIDDVVVADESLAESSQVRAIVTEITSRRPMDVATLEHQHLLLTDLPGLGQYRGTLSPSKQKNSGAVTLVFDKQERSVNQGFVRVDNYGSQFLGPYQASVGWRGTLVPLQETSVTGQVSLPMREFSSLNIIQRIPLQPNFSLELSAGGGRAEPGGNLSNQEIESRALNGSVGLRYQVVRQRRENLNVGVSLEARNSQSTILGAPLSKDRTRTVRVHGEYDLVDSYMGYNMLSTRLSRGIAGLGASHAADANLSRAGAKPDFTKLEVDFSRLQMLSSAWSGLLTLSGQKASGSLFSSEEFGFGGQRFGRAYDQSEITGDEGVAAGIELRYHGLPEWGSLQAMPYGFYDIGRIWNRNLGQQSRVDASSVGAGLRLSHAAGAQVSVQAAFPLIRDADNPLYGGNGSSPRIGVQFGYAF